MKTLLSIILLLLLHTAVSAQLIQHGPQTTKIGSMALSVCAQKTTNLLFPYPVKSVDKGSRDILVQKAKGVEYLLQVKAAGDEGFNPTNLTVVTTDGEFYSFVVNYQKDPADLNFRFGPASATPQTAPSISAENEAMIECNAIQITGTKGFLGRPASDKFGIRIAMEAIYVDGDLMYYQLGLRNDSYIPYDIGQLRFSVRDQKKVRRMATQENELLPVFTYGNTKTIAANSQEQIVLVFDKHTIPDKKYLAIQLMEQNGGRNLSLRTGNKTLVKARPLATAQ